jgi:hypothetical protein
MVLDEGVIMLATCPQATMTTFVWAPVILHGFGGPAAEGAHTAAATIKEQSLDVFLRFLLAQLGHFRALVSHPGFLSKQPDQQMALTYLTTITKEQDPVRREQKLRAYEAQVTADFAKRSRPPRKNAPSPGEAAPATQTPAVIHLPPSTKRRPLTHVQKKQRILRLRALARFLT